MAHVEGVIQRLRPLPSGGVAPVQELPCLTNGVSQARLPHLLILHDHRCYGRSKELSHVVDGSGSRVVLGGLGDDSTGPVCLLLPVHFLS